MSSEKEAEAAALSCVFAVALILIGTPLHLLWEGWVLLKLWGWFLIPLGAPVATLGQLMGVSIVLAIITTKQKESDAKGKSLNAILINTATHMALVPGLGLAWGYVIHVWIR